MDSDEDGEISVNKKKSGQVRETLVPKTIQFEGNRLDGLSDYSKQEQNRANEWIIHLF